MNIKKIISGGQTGVDRAALDAALNCGFPAGGWCPEGRKAEDGIISDHYPAQELLGGGYRQRTKRNVVNSDGTLIVYDERLSGGTELTLLFCIKEKKPYLLVDTDELNESRAIEKVWRFILQEKIKVLNVAGPRASNAPNIGAYVNRVLSSIIRQNSTGQ